MYTVSGGLIPYTINTWQEKAGMFIQTSCFLHSAGATLTPYVVSLFLPEPEQNKPSTTSSNASNHNVSEYRNDDIFVKLSTGASSFESSPNFAANWTGMSKNFTDETQDVEYATNNSSSSVILIPFILPAVGLIISAIFYMIVPPLEKRYKTHLRSTVESKSGEIVPLKRDNSQTEGSRMPWMLFTLAFCFCALMGGIEITYGGWIIAFGVQHFQYSYSDIALAASLFWFGETVGRLFAIYGSKRFRAKHYLYVHLVILNVANVAWLLMGHLHLLISYVCAFIAGMSISPLLGSIFMYLQSVTILEEWVASVLHLALFVGSMTLPYLVGYMFANISPLCFLYVLLASTLCELALFIVIDVFNHRRLKSIPSQTVRDIHPKPLTMAHFAGSHMSLHT